MTDSLSSKEHYIRYIHDDRLINRSQVELSTLERMRVANEQSDRTPVVIVWLLDFKLPMQSVPITTNVVSLNRAQARCARYIIM
jgi:hypothetical protein